MLQPKKIPQKHNSLCFDAREGGKPTASPTSASMCKHNTLRLKHKMVAVGGLGQGALLIRGIHQQFSFRSMSSCCFILWRTGIMYKAESWVFFHTSPSVCQYCWLSISWGLISQRTLRPLMKVEESRGVSKHQRQQGASPHCACVCTSGN